MDMCSGSPGRRLASSSASRPAAPRQDDPRAFFTSESDRGLAVLPQYPHKCGLTRKCGYFGHYTRIIPAFLTKTSIIPAFSTKKIRNYRKQISISLISIYIFFE